MDLLIHKVSISDEAKFDYETSVSPSFCFIQKEIKEELEFYIQQTKKLHNKYYFRVKYYDETTDNYLMLFIRRRIHDFSTMRVWNLVGICMWDDWKEDLEEDGNIKGWLDTSLSPDENEEDWVEVMRFRQAEEERLRKIDEEEQQKYEQLFGR